ncbi:MAG: tetratricopeptide repeat protein [Myxococcota bacterium]|nr:tetratricopeptide repeat protein [Myxococcota bacterium]
MSREPRDLDPLNAHLDRAWDLVAEGDFEGAFAAAQKSLEIDEASPEAHNLMGYVLAANGQLGDALEHYREAIELDGSFFEAMLNASEAFLQLGQLQEALAMASDAQDVAHTDDEKADALLLQIDALLAAGRREEAEALVPDLPRGPFENQHLEFLVGRALYETGDVEGASMRIEQAALTGSTDPEVFYYLGLVRENRGDVRGATAAFLQSRDLELDLPRAPWSEPFARFERRVAAALRALPEPLAHALDGALVVVDDLPGAEVVSEGVDPRATVLLDDLPLSDGTTLRRCFVSSERAFARCPRCQRGVARRAMPRFACGVALRAMPRFACGVALRGVLRGVRRALHGVAPRSRGARNANRVWLRDRAPFVACPRSPNDSRLSRTATETPCTRSCTGSATSACRTSRSLRCRSWRSARSRRCARSRGSPRTSRSPRIACCATSG